ncbi:MAG: phosphoribosylformylglycinamidine synthase subunit PurQ [Clostridia bacterium]|nr:phosphoribosylformylglycinamidine synthase subunit PurQ [Clostridia bacterium]
MSQNKERLINGFSAFSEKELEDFASKFGFCLSKGELIYLQKYSKDISKDLTFGEIKLFEKICKNKNNVIFSEIDKVDIDTPNPHIAESYAKYLRECESRKEKFGTYPCLSDLANISFFKGKQFEKSDRAYGSFLQKIRFGEGKSEEGKCAYLLKTTSNDVDESLVFDAICDLLACRYTPFFMDLTGEYPDPQKEKSEKLVDCTAKTGIATTKYDYFDSKIDADSETVLVCGYGQVGCVAKHYPKEEDKLLFVECEDKEDVLRKMIAFSYERKSVRLIVDAKFTKKEDFVYNTYRLVGSFKAQNIEKDGFIVVSRPRDEEELKSALLSYGLAVTTFGEVTSDGQVVCDDINISVDALDGYNVRKTINISLSEKKSTKTSKVNALAGVYLEKGELSQASKSTLSEYSVCSQKGLSEQFDYSAGGLNRFVPLGGKYSLTPSIQSVYAFPVSNSEERVVHAKSVYPALYKESPYIAGVNAVVSAVAKLVCNGVKRQDVTVCISEKHRENSENQAFSALLGAFSARFGLGVDTCENGVEECNTNSFSAHAIGVNKSDKNISNVFEKVGRVYKLALKRDEYGMIDFEHASRLFDCLNENIESGNVLSATVVEDGGVQSTIIKSCIGNGLGFDFDKNQNNLFVNSYGDIVVMCNETAPLLDFSPEYIGSTDTDGRFDFSKEFSLNSFGATQSFTSPLENIFKSTAQSRGLINNVRYKTDKSLTSEQKFNKPTVLIPVFKSTANYFEYVRAFKSAGADVVALRIDDDSKNVDTFIEFLDKTSILVFADGKDVSNQICDFVRSGEVFEKVEEFIKTKDGLIYGCGCGADAICRLGLITGKMRKRDDENVTLVNNNVGRRVCQNFLVRVSSVLSPWLYGAELGEKYHTSVVTDKGAFRFGEGILETLIEKGQIATQYVDNKGFATMESPFNPTGSVFAVESLTSPCGRVIARVGKQTRYIDENEISIIESGVKYFKQ